MALIFDYEPQERQELLHACPATQILYGGAAGGGKSHSLLWDAILFCMENPGLDAYLFRRKYPDLEKTHIRRIKQFQNKYQNIGLYNETHKRFQFSNGSVLNFCHAERDEDVDNYLSAEMHWLGLDEAVKFTPRQIEFLRSRVRLGSFTPTQKRFLPRIVMATNPGGPSHNWIRKNFIDPHPAGEQIFEDLTTRVTKPDGSIKLKGWSSIYIPSRLSDNKYIDANYEGALSALPDALARAYRDGDWDVVEGQALETLTRERHMVRPFPIPKHWPKFMAMDWGTAKPFAIGWFTVSDGVTPEAQIYYKSEDKMVYFPEGALILYREWYGWNGTEDTGCRMESHEVAKKSLQIEEMSGDVMLYRVGDTNMWAQYDGPSPQETMYKSTGGRWVMRKAKKDRRANYTEFRYRLKGEEDGPLFFATSNCEHFWRTVPPLQLDSNEPEKGVGPNQEDHNYDMCAYAMSSRPIFRTIDQYHEEENQAIRRLRNSLKNNSGFYDT